MARFRGTRSTDKALVILTGTILGVVVVAFLYWAQQVLIPVALAVYLAFLLSPVVRQFQRWGLPRIPAVLTVTLLTAVVVLSVGYVVASQIGGLVDELPNYSGNIKKKV